MDVRAVWEHYARRYPELRQFAASVMVARNQEFADWTELVQPGDEIAFLPPVSGGSGSAYAEVSTEDGSFFALTRGPIDLAQIRRRVRTDSDGAVVVFEGVVRNQSGGRATRFLEYEAYEPLALKVLVRLGRWLRSRYPITRLAVVHRLGRVEIGEAAVVIIASAAHRAAAFQAVQEAIERIKHAVPIWKKEYFADGEVWTEGQWDLRGLEG